ncbi:MAG TPA: amino acid permease [Candidatus Thermoplasmatota archaeon]|nr:amino acid permease [Candidatus Thermoplasmatota archaeon]
MFVIVVVSTMTLDEPDECLKKELGLFEVFAIASGAMISSGLFILPAIAYQETGASVIISYLIATLLMLPTLLSASELTTAMPKAGGDYFFIDRSMGPALGTIGGTASWFALSAKTAFALIGIGAFVQLFNPGLSDFYLKIIAVVFCIIFTIINLAGVKHAGKTQVYLVAGLLSILIIYVGIGFFYFEPARFQPFTPYGVGSIFATAGIVFVSFMGLIKVCSVAEEIEKPKRNIPLGMLLAWSMVSTLYILVVSVTVGLLDHTTLTNTLMPISKGAEVFAGEIGLILLGVAAVLAFITTANAGILSSSRYPLALSKDQLLPSFFSKLSKKGTPVVSILFTSGFMISIILFLDLEGLVKIASTLVLLLYVLVNLSVVMMRESNIRNYRPSFSSPFYPWIQIVGIIGYIWLIYEMGVISIAIVGCFICGGYAWYWIFARDKIWREYSLLNVVERITGEKNTGYLLDEELREILIDRDRLHEKRFENLIKNCEVLDLQKLLTPDKLLTVLSVKLSDRLCINEDKLYNLLKSKECDSNIVLHPGLGIFSHLIKGRGKLDIVLVRTKKGLILSKDIDPIYSFFTIVASEDQKNFYWHTLMWVAQIAEQEDFQDNWLRAKSEKDLRNVFLTAWKKREIY